MGAPHGELATAICNAAEPLEHASRQDIDDTIAGLNRQGMPFKAVSREDIDLMRTSADFIKGFIAAQANNEEAKLEMNYIYETIFEV